MNKKQFQKMQIGIKYTEYKNSAPEIVDNFSITSLSCALSGGYYNFKLQTINQCAYFGIYNTCMSNSDEIWKFLEEICDKDFDMTMWEIDLEGYGAKLIAEDLKDENIRLTIINYRWSEFYYDKDLDIVNVDKNKYFDDKKEHIQLDIIVNKKIFIYHFYIELLYIFDKNVYRKNTKDIVLYNHNNIKAKISSKKIAKYLGFTKAKDKDLHLYKLLGGIQANELMSNVKFGSLDEIRDTLVKGANPNAIVINDTKETHSIFDEIVSQYSKRLFTYKLWKETSYNKLKQFSNIVKLENNFAQQHEKEIQDKYFEIIKLLLEFGAKTYITLDCYYGLNFTKPNWYNILELLLKNNCKITSSLRKALLLFDRQFIDLFDKYNCYSSYRWID